MPAALIIILIVGHALFLGAFFVVFFRAKRAREGREAAVRGEREGGPPTTF